MTITVEFNKRRYHEQSEMIGWCRAYFGTHRYNRMYSEPLSWEGLGTWGVSTVFGNTYFYFKNENDAVWFQLRWT